MSIRREDPLVTSARREAWLVLVIFSAAMCYTVVYCYLTGYDRPPESLTLLFGFPDWVFWGIVAPWVVCTLVSFWFGDTFMRDSELGPSAETDADDGSEASDV